jgi:hypothetical protein
MGKRLAAVTAAVVIAGGGLTVAAINPLQVAGANSAPTATSTPAPKSKAEHHGALAKALASLVKDGTLTQAQADKVASTVKADTKAGHKDRKVDRKARRTEIVALVAKTIGSTPEQVRAGVKGGTSIAAQAQAKGVTRQTVSDALTKAFNDRIDAAVAAGKIPAQRAEKAKARIPQAVTRILDANGSHQAHPRGN